MNLFHCPTKAVIFLPILLALYCFSAYAEYTTVDISAYINGQVNRGTTDFPVGLSTGNTGSNIPFLTSVCGNACTGGGIYSVGQTNSIGQAFLGRTSGTNANSFTDPLTINLTNYNLTGQVSFYLLLNNYWGTNNLNEYNVTINYLGGASQIFQSIGGVDTRDFNNSGFSNSVSSDTGNWWTNSATAGASYQRLDVRRFTTNSAAKVTGITLTQTSPDIGFLSGLTFSTLPVVALPAENAPVVTLTNITNTASNSHLASALGVTLNPTFEGGTLTAVADGTISKDFIVMANGGKIDLNSKNIVLSGTLANLTGAAGSLVIEGGSLTATGNNSSFSGNLQVIAGANLSVSSASNLGSGTLSLLGTPTTAATLTTTASMTINNTIEVAGDPVFNVAPGTTTTVSSVIADVDANTWGDVQVSGGGTLNLTGVNTYTGPTIIDLGSRLALSGLGSIARSGIAGQGGVINHGSVDVTGKTTDVSLVSYTQSSTGVLKINFSPSSNQKLIISGATSLAGGIILEASPGVYSVGRYTILTSTGGLTGTFATSTINTYSYTSLSPSFSYDANNVYFNLALPGPLPAHTQASLSPNAYGLKSAFNLQSAIINNGLSYDCTTFAKNGICLSAGGRNTSTDSLSTNTSGTLLIASYRASEKVRLGAYLDQNLSTRNETGVRLSNNTPMAGAFGVWNQNADGTGYELRLAAGYSDKNVTVNRSVIETSEAGSGSSSLKSTALLATLSRGVQINNGRWIASPYLGVRYTKIKRDAYTEDLTAAVMYPLTYANLKQETTSALVGVRLNGRVGEKIGWMATVGVEWDMNHNSDDYAVSGLDELTPVALNNQSKHVRPAASTGISYVIDKRQTLGAQASYRQEAFQSSASVSGMMTYQVGF